MSAPPSALKKTAASAIRSRKPVQPLVLQAESVFKNVQKESTNVLRFTLAPTHVSYANTLRRTIITEVETVAFRADIKEDGSTSDVQIFKNSTPMSNEMLAHRLGLVPIHVADPLKWSPDEYTFKLDITNNSTDLLDVVASDIQVYKNRGPEEDPLLVPSVQFFHPDPVTHDTCLLAVLKGKTGTQDAESISFTARATVGVGRENASFMPVTSRCSYGYTLDTDPERRKENFTAWLTKSKKVLASELEANPTRKGELEREFATMEVQRCFLIDVKGEPYSFDFIVESVGVLSPSYSVGRALDILQTKLMRYASVEVGDLPEGLKVRPADAQMKGFDFMFQHEDHTLGNLLQTYMDQNMIDNNEITFAGYKVPHPLRDEMLLRIGVADGMEMTARSAVAKAARNCAQMFRDWAAQWQAAAAASA